MQLTTKGNANIDRMMEMRKNDDINPESSVNQDGLYMYLKESGQICKPIISTIWDDPPKCWKINKRNRQWQWDCFCSHIRTSLFSLMLHRHTGGISLSSWSCQLGTACCISLLEGKVALSFWVMEHSTLAYAPAACARSTGWKPYFAQLLFWWIQT